MNEDTPPYPTKQDVECALAKSLCDVCAALTTYRTAEPKDEWDCIRNMTIALEDCDIALEELEKEQRYACRDYEAPR